MEGQNSRPYEQKDFPEGFVMVSSSALLAVKYEDCHERPCNPEKACLGHLEVIFPPKKGQTGLGSRWRYTGVPNELFAEMLKQHSLGSFFGKNVRGKFQAFSVEEPEKKSGV